MPGAEDGAAGPYAHVPVETTRETASSTRRLSEPRIGAEEVAEM